MSDSDGIPDFYCEIHTPDSIRQNYAPEGRCLGCDAKLSIYRTMTGGEWDRWCAPCQTLGTFPLQCQSCWETFPSYGTRTICSKCLVPAQRKKREEWAIERAEQAHSLINVWNHSIEQVAKLLKYENVLEARRAIESYLLLGVCA